MLCRPKKGADDGEDIDGWAEACAVFDLGPETAEGSDNAAVAAEEGDMRSEKQVGKRPVAAPVAEQPSKRQWLPPSPSAAAAATSATADDLKDGRRGGVTSKGRSGDG
uniref:Uncharacterized protein n=1 Tax=Oryza meridionalis TaxID=40149 RepID=A0A0E0DYJ4_9ORYZ